MSSPRITSPRIIECLGLPASGKSSFLAKLLHQPDADFLTRKQAETRIAKQLGFFHRFGLYLALLCSKRFRPFLLAKSEQRQAMYWLLRDLFLYEHYDDRWPPLVLDEGYAQHLAFAALILDRSPSELATDFPLPETLPLGVICFCLDASTQAYETLCQRGFPSSWRAVSAEHRKERFYFFASRLQETRQAIASHSKVQVISILEIENKKTAEDFSSTVFSLFNVLQIFSQSFLSAETASHSKHSTH